MSSDTHQNFSWAASGDGGQTSDWGGRAHPLRTAPASASNAA